MAVNTRVVVAILCGVVAAVGAASIGLPQPDLYNNAEDTLIFAQVVSVL